MARDGDFSGGLRARPPAAATGGGGWEEICGEDLEAARADRYLARCGDMQHNAWDMARGVQGVSMHYELMINDPIRFNCISRGRRRRRE